MQHSLETIGPATSPRLLKNKSSLPLCPPPRGCKSRARGPAGSGPRTLVAPPPPIPPPAQRAQLEAHVRGAGRAGRRRCWGFSRLAAAEPKAAGGGEEGGAGAGCGGARRAGNARGAGLQSCPVAASGQWPSVWSPTSISGRTCSRGCGHSGRR